jgi:cysteine-rich repeat protein
VVAHKEGVKHASQRQRYRAGTFLLVAAGIWASLGSSVQARRHAKVSPCPAARYVVAGEPLVSGDSAPRTSMLAVGSVVGVDGICGTIAPQILRESRSGATRVVAKWRRCAGLRSSARLTGSITDGCSRLSGTLKARHFKRRFEALLSRCGDSIVDSTGGEECDDGNTVPGDGCEPTCRKTSVADKLQAMEASGLLPKLDRTESLAGIDADADGVRDDLAGLIAALPDAGSQKAALLQLARALNAALTSDSANSAAIGRSSDALNDALHCVSLRYDSGSAVQRAAQVRNFVVNTRQRFTAYLAYNLALDGSVFSEPQGDTCR